MRNLVSGSSFTAPRTPGRSIAALVITSAVLVALVGCDSVVSPSLTSTAAGSSAAPRSFSTVAAPATTVGPVRPPGVSLTAAPFLFGCAEGVPRCTEIVPGTYYTAGEWALLPGLTFTLRSGWSSSANEAGELELHPIGDDHDEILVWRDVVPWRDGRAVVDAHSDPDAWIARLAGDPCLNVSKPERVVLGSRTDLRGGGQPADLEALAVFVAVAADPAYQAAGCPGSRQVDILSDPMHWDHALTIGGDEMNDPGCPCKSVQRLYFAAIGYVSHRHLLVVALQSYGPNGVVDASFASLQAAAQPVLDSLIVPAIVVDN